MKTLPDLDWIHSLDKEMWPPELLETGYIKLQAKRRISMEEWQRVVDISAGHKLIVSMISTSMFGGVGISLRKHPEYPGLPVEDPILVLTQDHLPEELMKDPEKPYPGGCSRKAWKVFSRLARTKQNMAWLKEYGLRAPGKPLDYDY